MKPEQGSADRRVRRVRACVLVGLIMLIEACGPGSATAPVASARPPLAADVSFGGRVEELCLAVTSSPSLPGAPFVAKVSPDGALAEPGTQSGILDGRGIANVAWKLKAGQEASWTITVDVTAADGSIKHLETGAGADQTGNVQNAQEPACPRS